MTKRRRFCLFFVLLSGALSVLWGSSIGWKNSGGPTDFQAVYFGARSLIQNHNPYNVADMERLYRSASGEVPTPTARQIFLVTLYVNLPTTFLLFAPMAVLPLSIAQVLWLILTATSLLLAAVLMGKLGEEYAPVLSAGLAGFLLANCEFIFSTGNSAGIVVGLCVVAAWCFLQERFALAGVVCMAITLSIKPHDSGMVWLYFLIAGGVYRKRALQTLAITAVLALSSVCWAWYVAPHWLEGWQSNMTAISARGGFNDPGPTAAVADTFAKVISLQAVFSVFRNDPRYYNSATYSIFGVLLVGWLFATLRSRSSREKDWLALASIVPITLLVTYHRVYDAKLMFLTIPACAMLWTKGGWIRWLAFALSTAGIIVSSDVALILFDLCVKGLHLSIATLSGQILTVLLQRQATVVLFLVEVFYLCVYVRSAFVPASSALPGKGKREQQASVSA